MRDRANTELTPGDRVLYLVKGTSSSWLEWGTVEGFTPKMIKVRPYKPSAPRPPDVVTRFPHSVVKPATPPVW